MANAVATRLGGFAFHAYALADDFGFVPSHRAHNAQLRADLVHEKQAGIQIQIAQFVHRPFGAVFAIGFHQIRHHRVVAWTHGWIGHVAEEHAVAIFKAEEAIIGFAVARTQFAVIQGVQILTFFGVDLLAVLYRAHVIVMHGADMVAIQAVFILQLPIACKRVSRFAWQHFQFTRRRLFYHQIQKHFGIAQKFFQGIGGVDVQAHKHKATVAGNAALFQATAFFVKVFAILRRGFHFEQASIRFVTPCVKRAGKRRLIAFADAG